jgi:hypothetical protein
METIIQVLVELASGPFNYFPLVSFLQQPAIPFVFYYGMDYTGFQYGGNQSGKHFLMVLYGNNSLGLAWGLACGGATGRCDWRRLLRGKGASGGLVRWTPYGDCACRVQRETMNPTIWWRGAAAVGEALAKKAPPGQTLFSKFLFSGGFLSISKFQIFFLVRNYTPV